MYPISHSMAPFKSIRAIQQEQRQKITKYDKAREAYNKALAECDKAGQAMNTAKTAYVDANLRKTAKNNKDQNLNRTCKRNKEAFLEAEKLYKKAQKTRRIAKGVFDQVSCLLGRDQQSHVQHPMSGHIYIPTRIQPAQDSDQDSDQSSEEAPPQPRPVGPTTDSPSFYAPAALYSQSTEVPIVMAVAIDDIQHGNELPLSEYVPMPLTEVQLAPSSEEIPLQPQPIDPINSPCFSAFAASSSQIPEATIVEAIAMDLDNFGVHRAAETLESFRTLNEPYSGHKRPAPATEDPEDDLPSLKWLMTIHP